MRKPAILIPLVIATMISCNNAANNDTANTKKADTAMAAAPMKDTVPPAPAMDSATKMKKEMEYMTAGDMQKMLATYDGKWSADITIWMTPNAQPMKIASSHENKMIMGGRYQQTTAKSNMGGMPYEGLTITGYDNAKKVFVVSGIDNMGTGIMNLEGPWDAASRTITLKGNMTDPATGKDIPVRETIQLTDANNEVMDMYMNGKDGKEFKMMETKFVRK